jgi:quaternary ammonium compound-resistance protein SugE
MKIGWIYLLVAGLLEIGFVTTLKLTHDNKNSSLNFVFFICLIGSFYFLDKSLSTIPVGTAYAIWTGIGATGAAIIGILYFKDPVTFGRLMFLCLLIISIIGLKLTSNPS